MKVTIQDLSSGKTKTMDKRYADVLVKMRRAVYVGGEVKPEKKIVGESSPQTYQTKVMTPETPTNNTIVKEVNEGQSTEEILRNFGIGNQPNEPEKRKPGRPKKSEE